MTARGDAPSLEEKARAWIADDPDDGDRRELEQLLGADTREARSELEDRFSDRLHFGTAGLRGAVAAGPNRMNRAVVRAATAAVAAWLASRDPASRERGVVLGRDARHGSAAFCDEAASVLAGAGFRVHLLPPERPTPLLAFSVPHLDAAAGIMITASHNPPADNGYKLYLDDGAQIIPPFDAEIEALMAEVGPLSAVPLARPDGPLVVVHGDDLEEAFSSALAARSPAPPGAGDLRIVYTPMHGVAGALFERTLSKAGFPSPAVVPEQATPDADFPTVAFPNPEEPGALDHALALAARTEADIMIAHDPDGDRLAVALPDREGRSWRRMSGDEVGALLGTAVLEETAEEPEPSERLVATTIVSSRLLSKVAAEAGVRYAETLTGFKWIVRAGADSPSARFVFGYEEALGYSVGTIVRDKDGLGAALAILARLATLRTRGRDFADEWDDLERRFGVHLTGQLSLPCEHPDETMGSLRAQPRDEIGGARVVRTTDLLQPDSDTGLPASDVLVYFLERDRVVVRPSGTEPKLKVYFEVVRPVEGDLAGARNAAAKSLAVLQEEMHLLLGAR